MPHNKPIRLRAAVRGDFRAPVRTLFLLAAWAALLSPNPVALLLAGCIWFGRARPAGGLRAARAGGADPAVLIHPDGRVSLESGGETLFEGVLAARQWYSSRGAVLRAVAKRKSICVPILPGRQDGDGFRRLGVWLRQGAFRPAGA